VYGAPAGFALMVAAVSPDCQRLKARVVMQLPPPVPLGIRSMTKLLLPLNEPTLLPGMGRPASTLPGCSRAACSAMSGRGGNQQDEAVEERKIRFEVVRIPVHCDLRWGGARPLEGTTAHRLEVLGAERGCLVAQGGIAAVNCAVRIRRSSG
jgi:hypothetical protein